MKVPVKNKHNQIRTTLLHLSCIAQVGPALVQRIVDSFGFEKILDLYTFSAHDLAHRVRCSLSVAQKVVQGLADKALLDKELAAIEKHAVQWYTWYDQEYPPLLRSIYLPPVVLYGKSTGSVAQICSRPAVALVGARKADSYGKKCIENIVGPLVDAGYTIVSGGALGADTMAHQATLACGGTTVACIGSGIAHPYPRRNEKLFEALCDSGSALVSCFPIELCALPGNFPARNRVIAGLAQATVVIQAGKKSGALITANYALEQGRDVCAVPGACTNLLSAGCHSLIQQGAALVCSGSDVLSVLGHAPAPYDHKAQQKTIGTQVHKPVDPLVALCEQPQQFDALLEHTDLSFELLQERLCQLSIDGKLEQDFMGRWTKRA